MPKIMVTTETSVEKIEIKGPAVIYPNNPELPDLFLRFDEKDGALELRLWTEGLTGPFQMAMYPSQTATAMPMIAIRIGSRPEPAPCPCCNDLGIGRVHPRQIEGDQP